MPLVHRRTMCGLAEEFLANQSEVPELRELWIYKQAMLENSRQGTNLPATYSAGIVTNLFFLCRFWYLHSFAPKANPLSRISPTASSDCMRLNREARNTSPCQRLNPSPRIPKTMRSQNPRNCPKAWSWTKMANRSFCLPAQPTLQ
jgi:hypothetical protein